MTEKSTQIFFAPCPRGLEAVLAGELVELGADAIKAAEGGVGFSGAMSVAYAANLHSRMASRVLWEVGSGRYRGEDDVYRGVTALDWPQWFDGALTIRVNVAAVRSPLNSLDFITLRIKDAVCDRFREACNGSRPTIDTARPHIRIHAYLTANEATLYMDTSGEPLYKRGFKLATVEAPIKENLAAGILRLSGWLPGTALVDPMCGSGTFLLEAAQMALDIAPGLARGFGFQKLKNFQSGLWQRLKGEAEARKKPVELLPIYGSDHYGDEIRGVKQNLEAAGLTGAVQLKQVDVLEASAPTESGTLVANPPYGVRIQAPEGMDVLYPKLGDALKKRFAGWNCYIISADPELPKLIGLKATKRTVLFNGALECRLLEYKIVAGQNRMKREE